MEKKYKVIAVDDQVDILDVLKIQYEETSYELITFSHVDEAIKYIFKYSKEIVLIISDFSMPVKTGFDFKRELNNFGIEIPFIVCTAFYDKTMAVEGMSLGVAYFMDKPLVNIELPQFVVDLIDKRKNVIEEEFLMITSFIDESSPMLDEIEELILKLESDPNNESTLNTYYRLLHTIKGTASCVGLTSLPSYVHAYENLVGKLKNKELSVNQEIINILLKGLDDVKLLYQEAKDGINNNNVLNLSTHFDYKPKETTTAFHPSEKENEIKHIEQKNENGNHEIEKKENKLSIDISILDSFMELSGELTVLRNTIFKAANQLSAKIPGDKDLINLTESLEEMHKVSSSLQNDISEMRKLQADTIFRPLRRVIRDSAKSLGKEINFQTNGDDLKIDTSISKILSNSLVHMIRNSIDHGIEQKNVRLERGKSAQGNISLAIREEGDFIVVDLQDDGNGLDIERIKKKALENKLYTEEQLKYLSEQKIYAIIFESGFSTAEKVTDISGRGVGMDMVRSSIEEFGGKIIINSKLQVGTQFTLILPIPKSVLIIKSLMVEINNGHYSIPLDEVKEVVTINEEEKNNLVLKIKESYYFRHNDHILPIIFLKNHFLHNNTFSNTDVDNLVVVKSNGHQYAIVVDKIFDIEEIVVKKLSNELRNNKLFKGVTFIGDGDLALILNLNGIAEIYKIESVSNEIEDRFSQNKIIDTANSFEFMQFTTGHQKAMALPLEAVYRLENINTSEIEYSGDVPLIQYRGGVLPLILTDYFLGFEKQISEESNLAESLKVIVVKSGSKLMGLIVDEISDIGNSESELNYELTDREEILGTVFIKDFTVSLLNIDYLFNQERNKINRNQKAA